MDSINVTSSILHRLYILALYVCVRVLRVLPLTRPAQTTRHQKSWPCLKVMSFANVLAYERSNFNSQKRAWLDEAKPTNAALWLQMNTLSKTASINSSLLSLLLLPSWIWIRTRFARVTPHVWTSESVYKGKARALLAFSSSGQLDFWTSNLHTQVF